MNTMRPGGGGRGGLSGRGGNGGEKPRTSKKKLLLRLWKYLYQYLWLLILAVVFTSASSLFALLGPRLSGSAIDAIGTKAGGVNFPVVYKYAGLMLVFYVASSCLSYLLSNIMIRLSRKVTYHMRRDVFNKLSRLPVGFFDRHQTGDVISVISYDIDTINASLSTDVVQILNSSITVIGSLIMMLTISPKLILIFVATIPMSVIFTRHMSRKVRPLYRERSRRLGELNGFVEEFTGGQKTVKAYRREEVMCSWFDEKNIAATAATHKADFNGCYMGPSVNFINNLSLALISVFGSLMYMGGSMTLGGISSFVLYSRKFSGPINEFANIMSELQSALAAAERVFMLLDEPEETADVENAIALKDTEGDVQMRNVRFGYDPEKIILKDLSLNANPGSVTAIVGPTGAGKTTIINLLMRFYDVLDGAIYVDGNEIRQLTRASLRGSYAMVLQETWLFHGTIFENIAYGKPGVTLEEVKAAARAARIDSYIESLPNGYDTLLSDGGVNISGGQKQLLTIARAMLMDANMLILDEATSNVDTQTERKIHAAMLELMKNRTCFVIAHRLSTVMHADRILVVRDGDVVEQGTHDELMEHRGFYYELYRSQFEAS